jgi:hypothetical protein
MCVDPFSTTSTIKAKQMLPSPAANASIRPVMTKDTREREAAIRALGAMRRLAVFRATHSPKNNVSSSSIRDPLYFAPLRFSGGGSSHGILPECNE